MGDAVDNVDLVDVVELARRLQLPWRWLEQEAEHERIPRLLVTGPRGRRFFLFNPAAVRDCLSRRAARGDKPPEGEGEP